MTKHKPIRSFIFFIFFQSIMLSAAGQDSLLNSYTDISKIGVARQITKTASSAYIHPKDDVQKIFSAISFFPGRQHTGTIPTGFVTKKLLLKFNICNTADTATSVFFFPGFYYNFINLFRIRSDSIQSLPSIFAPVNDSIGFKLIKLEGHDSATLIAELGFVKTHINTIRPRLVNSSQVEAFLATLHSGHNQDNLLTYIFCGLLLMMVLFSLANFFQGANRDFLYYSGYAFFLGGMLLTKALFDFRLDTVSFFFESYLDYIMQCIGIIFYMIFMQRFLDTKGRHPFLYRFYNIGIGLLVVSMMVYSWFHFFSNNFSAEYLTENATKILLLLMVAIFLVYSLRNWKNKLMRYLFWGNLFLFIFSVISLVTVILDDLFSHLPGIFNSALFYYEAGLFLELVFFLAGLNYKNRRNIIEQIRERESLKAQNKMQEYEKEIAVYKAQQEERERISADMHDELGSGMTAIRLMSEIARNKMKENTPVEIEKISASANDVLNKMNAIIWSMNSGNDTLDSLVSYIRAYSLGYFDNTPVECKVNSPQQIPASELSGDKRRNVFLCVKETLNNTLKHSNASLVSIDIVVNHSLIIIIEDNGRGIDMQQLRQFGNGLKNIAKRMESIGGTYTIENKNGTLTTLTLPL
ncbi:MAG: hypothetical protein HZB42_05185 [Sphingobacteriales bacterium]|nr:hypothetical protein [Sphingobacteriales bacterium]